MLKKAESKNLEAKLVLQLPSATGRSGREEKSEKGLWKKNEDDNGEKRIEHEKKIDEMRIDEVKKKEKKKKMNNGPTLCFEFVSSSTLSINQR
ncbi:hypothetical protein Y032_0221g2575 [Ancylostoma ceylanicum]|uniref:Uncharacterized protein n=1 Tax=Ancylostoma ceylanicum TaxID=53326 RepID=A0A016SI94_9BILA|nr:hypothetical protein Y032_0221g2575 [Ancylostoma ceylanicum]